MALHDPPPPNDLVTSAKRVNRAMFFVGAACASVAARFFLLPDELDRTSIGRALPGYWDETWSALYLIGGLLIMIGVGARRPRLELPGITLAGTATITNGVAIFVTNGSRAWSQVPLYVLAIWVFDGRRRDLQDLPRERRHRRQDPRPPPARVERRLVVSASLPIVMAAAQTPPPEGPSTIVTLLVALLGGGVITAIAQFLLVRPQKRSLEGGLQKMAVESARDMLKEAREENAELKRELREVEARCDTLEGEKRELQERLDTLERQAAEDRETIATLVERARRPRQ